MVRVSWRPRVRISVVPDKDIVRWSKEIYWPAHYVDAGCLGPHQLILDTVEGLRQFRPHVPSCGRRIEYFILNGISLF